MAARKIVGGLLITLSLAVALAALALAFTEEDKVPDFGLDRVVAAGAYGATAAVLFVIGIFLTVVQPAPTRYEAPPAPAPEEPVVIKRTEMSWGESATKNPDASLEGRLEDVNRRIGQVKVKYGLEQISKESYQIMMHDLEKEKSDIELQIAHGGP